MERGGGVGQRVTLPNSRHIEATESRGCHGFGQVALSDFRAKGFFEVRLWLDQGTRCPRAKNWRDQNALGEVTEGFLSDDQLNSS